MGTPILGAPTEIRLTKPRMFCTERHKHDPDIKRQSQIVRAPFQHHTFKITKSLWLYVRELFFRHSKADVIEMTGLKERTVDRIFQELNDEVLAIPVRAPITLGIDEGYYGTEGNQKKYIIFTDLDKNEVLWMTKSVSENAIKDAIQSMVGFENIQFVAMDLDGELRNSIRNALGDNVRIVIDKRHVLERARISMDKVRKTIWRPLSKEGRNGLKTVTQIINSEIQNLDSLCDEDFNLVTEWFELHQKLEDAFVLKVHFNRIFSHRTRKGAEKAYAKWVENVDLLETDAFDTTINTINSRHEDVFAYFETGITNAYTETANGLVDVMHRNSRGFMYFDSMLTRVLLRHGSKEYRVLIDPNQYTDNCEVIRSVSAIPQKVEGDPELDKEKPSGLNQSHVPVSIAAE